MLAEPSGERAGRDPLDLMGGALPRCAAGHLAEGLATGMGLLGQAGLPQLNGIYIGLGMVLLWLGGKLWVMRRYR